MLLLGACVGQCRFNAPMSISTAAPFYIKGRRRCANTRASKKSCRRLIQPACAINIVWHRV
jgi:hypothetical protein